MFDKLREGTYEKGNYPHRKKCPYCGKLIQDGSLVYWVHSTTKKLYPVKGIMVFSNWFVYHISCASKSYNDIDKEWILTQV